MAQPTGFDVSYANPAPNLQGAEFVIARASYGSTGLDSRTAQHVKATRSVRGRVLGLYHFAYPDPGDAKREAEHFLSVANRYKPEMLALDLEVAGTVGAGGLEAWALEFMRAIRGHAPMVLFYSMASWLPRFPALAKEFPHSLWVAHWNAPRPDCGPWATWKFWQKGGLRGIDYDVYNGDVSELRGEAGGDVVTQKEFEQMWQGEMGGFQAGIDARIAGKEQPGPDQVAANQGWRTADKIIRATGGGGGGLSPHQHELVGKTGNVG